MASSARKCGQCYVPQRAILALVLCLGTLNMYAQRTCFSIAVLCMTNHSAIKDAANKVPDFIDSAKQTITDKGCLLFNLTESSSTQDGPFLWDGQTRGIILGIFFWGYLIGQIPLGMLVQKCGCRTVICILLLILSATTVLTPLAAHTHVYCLYALRILAGIACAAWFPAFYQLWAAWAPVSERGLLVGIGFSGIYIGNALALPLTAVLCQSYFGWSIVFYIYGGMSFAYTVLWMIMVYDTPQQHPRISREEQKLLASHCGDSKGECVTVSRAVMWAMFKSVPVWAFVAVNVGFDWNGYTIATTIPTYMREALQFDITENAGMSALPFLSIWVGQLLFGWLSDKMITRSVASVTVVRKLMTSIGMFLPAAAMVSLGFFDCRHKYLAVAVFTLGQFFYSGLFAGGMLNPIEISPRYAGFIFSASNSISSITGFLAPLVASLLTPNKSNEEWRYVFILAAVICVLSGIVSVFFSSSNVQSWALLPSDVWSGGKQKGGILVERESEGEAETEALGSFLRISVEPISQKDI